MNEVVKFEFEFRGLDIFAAELVLEFDELVFELDSGFAFIIQVELKLFLGFLELLAFVFEHVFDFTHIMVIATEI